MRHEPKQVPMRHRAAAGLLAVLAFMIAGLASTPAQADFDYSAPQGVGTFLSLNQGSCLTTSFCVVPNYQGNVFTSTNPTGGSSTWTGKNIDGASRINDVSCPTTSLCVAVDESGNVITSTNANAGAPAGSSATWTVTAIDAGFDVADVSCPTATLCVAVDGSGRVITSTNPAGGSGAWTNKFTVGAGGAFYRIDCPSTTLCVAVDGAGEVATSTNPTAGPGAWGVMDIDGTTALFSVDCNAFLCVAGDQDGQVLASNNPTVTGTWHATDLDSNTTTNSLFGVSCPSSTLCVAGDNDGKIWTTKAPLASPAVWTGTQTQASQFRGLMCPSTALCVAPTNDGSVVLATPAKPTVLTLAATSVTATGATLHGKVDPRESNVTNCRFDIGASSGSYTTNVPCAETVGSGLGAVNVSAALSGLPQNTTFHYRLEATNANGTSYGIDQSFKTLTTVTEVKNTQPPQISGTPKTGSHLSCTNGQWTNNPTTFSITWERGLRSATTDNDPSWHTIAGASGSAYTVQAADEGSRVRCHVVASTQGVSGEASSSSLRTDRGVPVNTAPSTITGQQIKDHTVTCHPGDWQNSPSFTYQWTRSGLGPIPGATGPTYALKQYRDDSGHVVDPNGDGDHIVGCQVIGTNDLGSSAPAQVYAPLVIDGPPYPLDRPHIIVTRDDPSDDNPVKQTLTCPAGRWSDDYGTMGIQPFGYTWQWYRNGAAIQDATQSSYRPTSADFGRELTCVVTNLNPAGSRAGPADNPILVALPHGTSDTEIYREGGRNQVDPTNLMAISRDYLSAVNDTVLGRLHQGIDDATATCKDEARKNGWPTQFFAQPSTIPNEEVRCLILLYQPQLVQPFLDGGVRYLNGRCAPAAPPGSPVPMCPSLGIQVAPINPLKPPAQDSDLIAKLAPLSPKEILWDLDGNGTTDAVCPGSAPVLRTIYGWNQTWHPRAVILDQNDQAAHFGDIKWDNSLNPRSNPPDPATGVLRQTQVKVCSVSFDPPPDKKLPCVTSGDIGRIHISNANLCPVDERAINPKDFAQLLDTNTPQGHDLAGYLQATSDARLAGEGTAAAPKRGSPAASTKWVRWDHAPAPAGRVRTKDGTFLDAGQIKLLTGTLENTGAALSARNSPGNYNVPVARTFKSDVRGLTDRYNADKDGFASNQIYIARAANGSSALGTLDVNGVTMKALGDTAALLVPSDIQQALPNVHDMNLMGRDVSSYLGPAIQGQGIPLATGGSLKTTLKEEGTAAGQQILRETNLSDLTDAKKQGKDVADKLRQALDIEPFKFFGGSKVMVEKDGTATLQAHAELPGLTGASSSDKLGADVTIHADPDGRIKLDGIHLHAGKAFLIGMALSNVDVTYDHTTGVAITGQVTFPQLAGQGVNIKRFALSPTGAFQDLNLDYIAGPGGGIPLGQGAFLTTLGADINVAADIFSAHVVVSAGVSTGQGCPALGADGTMTISLAQPFYVDAKVDLLLSCLKLGDIHFRVDQSGAVQVDGSWGFDAGPVYFKAGVGGKFHYPDWEVWADGKGGIRHVLTGDVHAVLSNVGLAACGSLGIRVPGISDAIDSIFGGDSTIRVSGGASVDFIKGRPPLNQFEIINNLSLFIGCDIGRYYSLGHGKAVAPGVVAHGAAAGSTAFDVPAKATRGTLMSIEGAGAAPHVKLHSPSGEVFDFTDATGDTGKALQHDAGWGTVVDSEDRTVIIIPKAKPGTWTAEVAPGSPAVSRVRLAPLLPPALLKAHVSGRGTRRVLSYSILSQAGQTVRFSEQAPGGLKVLKTIKGGGRGKFRYTVGDATGTKRVVEADAFLNGQPRKRLIVARYKAKSPPVGKAKHLTVRRRGTHAVVRWGKAALGATYLVRVDYGSGNRIVLTPAKRGARTVNVPNVRRGEGLRIKVLASSAAGRSGPAAKATLEGSMRVGSVKKTPPYKPQHKKSKKKKHKRRKH